MPTFKKLLLANGLVVALGLSTLGFVVPSGADNGYPTQVATVQLALQIGTNHNSVGSAMSGHQKQNTYRTDALKAALQHVAKIYVIGYTDSSCNAAVCHRISQNKADGVAGALRARLKNDGDTTTVVIAIGRGAANPIASNNTAAGRAENNRTVIVYV